MAVAEAKKLSSAIEDDPKIVAGALEGLAEHRAGKGKSFENIDDLKSYLENH
jgi:predicted transcriptional regulator with HTH domain